MKQNQYIRTGYFQILLGLLLVFIAACGSVTNSKNQSVQLLPAQPDQQVLRAPIEGGDFDTLDPALAVNATNAVNMIFTGLVSTHDDGTVANQLAASYHISPDGLTYVFTLKPHLKFSDGTPLTAEDVAYSINRTLLPSTKSNVSGYLQLIKGFDEITSGKIPTLIGSSLIVNNHNTISIVISKPAAYFLEALTYPTSFVVEKKLIDKYGTKWTDHLEEGGGDGPFKVESYGHTSSLDLIPNPNYEDAKPKLQKLSLIIAGDRDSNYKAFLAGQYDFALVPYSQYSEAKDSPGFHFVPLQVNQYIGMNYLAKPLDNIKIRQALALAINKDLIVHRIMGDMMFPSNHIVPKGSPGYNPYLTGPDDASTKGDQNKARQLLTEGMKQAGYSSVNVLPQISLTYSIDDSISSNVMSAIVSQWKEVLGITVKLNGIHNNDLYQQEAATVGNTGPLQIWYDLWGANYPDPQNWLSTFFAKEVSQNAFNYGQNNSSAASAQQAVQAQLALADGEQDTAKRMQIYQNAEQKIVNDATWITICQATLIYVVNPKVQNLKFSPMSIITPEDLSQIYIAQ